MAATDASSEKTAMLVLTDFPAEQPDYDILKAWLDKNKDALITSAHGLLQIASGFRDATVAEFPSIIVFSPKEVYENVFFQGTF